MNIPKSFRTIAAGLALIGASALGAPASAADKEVTFAYQEMIVPMRVIMASGAIEKATGYKITWRKFAAGGDVIRAMASGNVALGEVGSSPLAAAASQGLDLQLFWILDDIADAEQLVARNGSGVEKVADLKGKTVATPFVSTAHYQLMFALKKAGLGPAQVKVLNMRPPEIAAAWERGDIDATFVWGAALAKAKASGKVIESAGNFAKDGRTTFDGIAVDRKWAEANKPFMVEMVKQLAAIDRRYADEKAKWTPESEEVKAVAKLTGAQPADVPEALAAYRFPTIEQQASADWLGGGAATALKNTAEFLKEQGKVPAVAPDYAKFVNPEFVKEAAR